MNRSRREPGNPSVHGIQGDDRNRTGATFPSSQGQSAGRRREWLRFVSDGTAAGTRVTTEGGDELLMVTGFVLSMPDASSPLTGSVDVLLPRVEVAAECDVHEVCPYCGSRAPAGPEEMGREGKS